jgi:outer membrane cobalamin receptor
MKNVLAYVSLWLLYAGASVAQQPASITPLSGQSEKAPAWRYELQAIDSTDTRTPPDIETIDNAFDFGFGAAAPLDLPQTETHYSSARADIDSGDFPPHDLTELIVVAHFTSWTVHLSGSHRSVYTIVNLQIDSIVAGTDPHLLAGSTIPLGIPGGTVTLPGTGTVISYEIARHSFPCEPNTQYLMFLRDRPASLPYYEFAKAWKIDNEVISPTSHFDIDRASRGEKSHAGTSLASAINEIISTEPWAQMYMGGGYSEIIEVATSVDPFPLQESDRSVGVLLPRQMPIGPDSVVDLLRTDPSLNIQARAAEGVQADLSIRGTTFEQSLILVNGLRVNDPETGHLNLDIPLPLDAVTRIDILHGSGSTFYGSDAIGGAVNLLTSKPWNGLALVARTGAGNYGSLEQHLRASYGTRYFAEELTGSRDTSDGFIPDRNYSSNALASESWLKWKPGTTDILLAASDRPYGANLFYGPYDSWERTKGWLATIQQELGRKTAASFGYRRHSDLFVLFADQPAIYENNHITTSYESALRRVDRLHGNTMLSYGLEVAGDAIHSNSLGQHARNQGAGYANLSMSSLGRFSLSIGAREEVLSGQGSVFSPNVAGGFTLTRTIRLRASVGHGFRQPTYVDLYYSDPTTIGNPALKPESSWSYEGGLDWKPANGRIALTAAGFRMQQKNAIDYSKQQLATAALTVAEKWQAVNVPSLNLTGAETSVHLRLTSTQQLQLSYTAVQAGPPPPGLISEYAYNYAAQNAIFGWTGQLPGAWGRQVTAHTQVNIVQKTGQTAYPLWDITAARNTGSIRPYLRLLNLSNTGYQEIPQVPMQGRTIMGGMELNWAKR